MNRKSVANKARKELRTIRKLLDGNTQSEKISIDAAEAIYGCAVELSYLASRLPMPSEGDLEPLLWKTSEHLSNWWDELAIPDYPAADAHLQSYLTSADDLSGILAAI